MQSVLDSSELWRTVSKPQQIPPLQMALLMDSKSSPDISPLLESSVYIIQSREWLDREQINMSPSMSLLPQWTIRCVLFPPTLYQTILSRTFPPHHHPPLPPFRVFTVELVHRPTHATKVVRQVWNVIWKRLAIFWNKLPIPAMWHANDCQHVCKKLFGPNFNLKYKIFTSPSSHIFICPTLVLVPVFG